MNRQGKKSQMILELLTIFLSLLMLEQNYSNPFFKMRIKKAHGNKLKKTYIKSRNSKLLLILIPIFFNSAYWGRVLKMKTNLLLSHAVLSDSLRPHRHKFLRPGDFSGKWVAISSSRGFSRPRIEPLSPARQDSLPMNHLGSPDAESCPILCDPMDCSTWALSRWCHLTISSSVVPFSFSLQSFPASGGQSIGVSASASVLPMNIQDWFPL